MVDRTTEEVTAPVNMAMVDRAAGEETALQVVKSEVKFEHGRVAKNSAETDKTVVDRTTWEETAPAYMAMVDRTTGEETALDKVVKSEVNLEPKKTASRDSAAGTSSTIGVGSEEEKLSYNNLRK